MDVSFIVPVYNVERYLKDCIDSILVQTVKSFEIILIDDGSTDSSKDICRSYESKFENIVYLGQENAGQSTSRNRGLSCAKGEYIFFVDSDDMLNMMPWNDVIEMMRDRQIDILGFDAIRISETGDSKLEEISSLNCCPETVFSGLEMIKQCGYKAVQPMPWLYLFRRTFLENNNIFFHEGCFHEDCEFCLKAICKAKKIVYKKQVFYCQRVTPNSTMRSVNPKKADDLIQVSDEIIRFIRTLSCDQSVRRELLSYVAYLNWAAIVTCENQGGNLKKFLTDNRTIAESLQWSGKYFIIVICIRLRLYRLIQKIARDKK